MANFDGQILFALIVALALSWGISQLIARRYAGKVLQFMRQPSALLEAGSPANVHRAPSPSVANLQRQNRHAVWRLRTALAIVSILLALAVALAAQAAYVDTGLGLRRTLTLTLIYAWISVPAIGLLERWSRGKIFLSSTAYMAAASLVVMLNSNGDQSLGWVLVWLFGEQLPLLVFLFVTSGRTLRSVCPYLLLVFFPLTASSLVGLGALDTALGGGPDTWVVDLVMLTNSYVVFGLFSVAPWLLAFYPLGRFARYLANAYRRKAFSEPLYLLAGLWAIALIIQALTLSHSVGFKSYALLMAWLLIPLSSRLLKPWLRPRHQPPTLLLLRVFRGDDAMEKLFDSVVEKWRHSGNTLLIAGKDLALRNLEPDELFAFLSGHLQDRFICDRQRLQAAIDDLDLQADPDGRYRVNEFFCYDNTWKGVLSMLVERSDQVLMDLRGYNSQREGCTHELLVLAAMPHLRNIVLLFDRDTERQAVERMLANSTTHIRWLDCNALAPRQLQAETLAALLAGE